MPSADSHDYKRNGTTTLLAAFEVATGKIKAAHKKRRRRKEFLDFMNDAVAAYPKREARGHPRQSQHPQEERKLGGAPPARNYPLHAHASIPAESGRGLVLDPEGQSLTGASFTSVEQLKEQIDAFIDNYNEQAESFVWTKSKVHQRRVKGPRLGDLCDSGY